MSKEKITKAELEAADLKEIEPPTFGNASGDNADFDEQKAAHDWAQSLPDKE